MRKLLIVFGTRPEAIKMAPLVNALKKEPSFKTIVCVTGQHREMLDQVLAIFKIVPEYDLNIMKAGQDLYDITTRVLMGLRDVLKEVQPDIVFVHGDTTTSTSAALAAFYMQIPVAHVEAGLRTNNIYSPWPEEMNRQLTGRIATYHFAPTSLARENLLNEHINDKNITVTGNTVIDALHTIIGHIRQNPEVCSGIEDNLRNRGYDTARIASGQGRKLILITGHRRENFGEGFIHICEAIRHLANKYPTVDFVYPMHLNPNVREPINQIFDGLTNLPFGKGWGSASNLFFIEPLEYLEFVFLMDKSTIILTDSGGIQEEAPGLGKPVLVMRTTTERPEAVEAGTVKLVGTDFDKIVKEVTTLLEDDHAYQEMSHSVNPYGDGNACARIIERMKNIG